MAKIPVTDCPAGPALDAAVAEVLGWTELDAGDASPAWETPEGKIRTWEPTSFGKWRPSEDIAAAWELVEFASVPELVGAALGGQPITVLRFGFSIGRALKEDTGSPDDEWGYRANFMSRMALGPKTTWAPTAPLAITCAFLLAHGMSEVEVPDDRAGS